MVAARSAAVKCREVRKSYTVGGTRVDALRGVNLDVYAGELLMLVGPSGCGKTTLISVMAGILDHDVGECMIFDRDLRAMDERSRTRYRGAAIGFVFQAYNLIPALTATENVAIPLQLQGVREKDAFVRAADMLGRVGLGDRLGTHPTQMSGGQQQRVAVARALVHNPRFVVCDEPTSALDNNTGQSVMELLKSLAVGEDRALVIVTHDSRIFHHADRIAAMDDGEIQRIVTSAADLHD